MLDGPAAFTAGLGWSPAARNGRRYRLGRSQDRLVALAVDAGRSTCADACVVLSLPGVVGDPAGQVLDLPAEGLLCRDDVPERRVVVVDAGLEFAAAGA